MARTNKSWNSYRLTRKKDGMTIGYFYGQSPSEIRRRKGTWDKRKYEMKKVK